VFWVISLPSSVWTCGRLASIFGTEYTLTTFMSRYVTRLQTQTKYCSCLPSPPKARSNHYSKHLLTTFPPLLEALTTFFIHAHCISSHFRHKFPLHSAMYLNIVGFVFQIFLSIAASLLIILILLHFYCLSNLFSFSFPVRRFHFLNYNSFA